VVIKTNRSDKIEIKKCHENIRARGVAFQKNYVSKILFIKSAVTSRGGPGPFQGPSSYPLLVVVADFTDWAILAPRFTEILTDGYETPYFLDSSVSLKPKFLSSQTFNKIIPVLII
jgi:hypothetical protein